MGKIGHLEVYASHLSPSSCRSPRLASTSGLELALELVQKPPVGTLHDDLLRCRFDHADFVQPQGVKPQRVRWIKTPPLIVRKAAQDLETHLIALLVSFACQKPRSPLRLLCADVRGLQDSSQCALGRNRIGFYKFSLRRQHAAEILRPGS